MTLTETFYRNPVGTKSHSVESGQQPKASLAWGHASALHLWCTFPAKRRQRRCRTMQLSPEIAVVGDHVLNPSGVRGEPNEPREMDRQESECLHSTETWAADRGLRRSFNTRGAN